ncbi:hypothetical protein BC832DRAFT_590135 [Gaertneriomyces semiglobifer]|nr:hypothetical protein BC832DRAFT_590135 [Gaertneriomyces semiglobifer]
MAASSSESSFAVISDLLPTVDEAPSVTYVPTGTTPRTSIPSQAQPSPSRQSTSRRLSVPATSFSQAPPKVALEPEPRPSVGRRLSTPVISRTRAASQPETSNVLLHLHTIVQSAKLINAPTTQDTALEKAAFYDRMVNVLGEGGAEAEALVMGVQAAKDVRQELAQLKEGRAGEESLTGLETSASSDSAQPLGSAGASTNNTLSSRPSSAKKLKNFLTSLIRPTVAPATSNDTSAPAPPINVQGVSMPALRLLHKQVIAAMDEYEGCVMGESMERESDLLAASKRAVEKAKEDTRLRLVAEYEKETNHTSCNLKIDHLESENKILHTESKRLLTENKSLQEELDSLRHFKESAEEEYDLLVKDLARRRLLVRSLKERCARLMASTTLDKETADTPVPNEALNDDGDETDLDDDDSEWAKWCRAHSFSRPHWNPSTVTTALSGRPPPSVIHVGETGEVHRVLEDDELDKRNSRPASANPQLSWRRLLQKWKLERKAKRKLKRQVQTQVENLQTINRRLTDYFAQIQTISRALPEPATLVQTNNGVHSDLESQQEHILTMITEMLQPETEQSSSDTTTMSHWSTSSSSSSESEKATATPTPHTRRRPASAPRLNAGIPSSEHHLQPSTFSHHMPPEFFSSITNRAKTAALAVGITHAEELVKNRPKGGKPLHGVPPPSQVRGRPSSAPVKRTVQFTTHDKIVIPSGDSSHKSRLGPQIMLEDGYSVTDVPSEEHKPRVAWPSPKVSSRPTSAAKSATRTRPSSATMAHGGLVGVGIGIPGRTIPKQPREEVKKDFMVSGKKAG